MHDLHSHVMKGFGNCLDLGIEYPTLEEAVYNCVRSAVQTMQHMPDHERKWLRHSLSKWYPVHQQAEAYSNEEAPPVRVQPTAADISFMDSVMLWFQEIVLDGNSRFSAADRTRVAGKALYLHCAGLKDEEARKVIKVKVAYGPLRAEALGSISEWLWQDAAVRREFPLHVRLPNALWKYGEHHHRETPKLEAQSGTAADSRWRGIAGQSVPKAQRERILAELLPPSSSE